MRSKAEVSVLRCRRAAGDPQRSFALCRLNRDFEFDLATMATKKYSTAIRITTGLLGLVGVAAIGFNALQEGSLRSDAVSLFMLFAKLFAAYIFFTLHFLEQAHWRF